MVALAIGCWMRGRSGVCAWQSGSRMPSERCFFCWHSEGFLCRSRMLQEGWSCAQLLHSAEKEGHAPCSTSACFSARRLCKFKQRITKEIVGGPKVETDPRRDYNYHTVTWGRKNAFADDRLSGAYDRVSARDRVGGPAPLMRSDSMISIPSQCRCDLSFGIDIAPG